MLMGNFGATMPAPAQNTPEPATGLSLLALGGLGVLARGKKK
ncbi:MAG: PEP-CTERM sorting domain-containing protein [Nanoarchaeota archaeon]